MILIKIGLKLWYFLHCQHDQSTYDDDNDHDDDDDEDDDDGDDDDIINGEHSKISTIIDIIFG